jgi:fatty-acyl-CoA synthase
VQSREGCGQIEALEISVDVSRTVLSPLSFLVRSATVWADRPAVVDGARRWTYAELFKRTELLSGLLVAAGVRPGDRVATLLPNVGAMLEAHYAVPGIGAVLVPLNTRLAADDYVYILNHSGPTALIADVSYRDLLAPALSNRQAMHIVWTGGSGRDDLDSQLAGASPQALKLPADENDLLSINYTSGTTGLPKGVMTSHRGAYLHTLGVIADAGLTPSSRYLWTLPMFHCNGWAYTWAVTAAGAVHVCLPRVDGAAMWNAITTERITHMCAAPTVLSMLIRDPHATSTPDPVRLFVGGAPPSPALITLAGALGIELTHLYGLTETYGPIAICAWNPDWDALDPDERSRLRSRQGVATVVSQALRVVDKSMRDVPANADALGEVVMRGNNVMLGYYRDPDATTQAFRGGWFHSGDLAVMHPDGYIEIRDREKDVIISGGENISTVEIENALLAHPSIAEAAVVGAPDERWGEVPVAFVVPNRGMTVDADEVLAFVRGRIARFKTPKQLEITTSLPKTGTGKIQKFALRQQVRTQRSC